MRWVYDVPGCFVDLDGNAYISGNTERDMDVADSEQSDFDQEQCGDMSEVNTDCGDITEECEYASETDLAHLFGYDLPSTDFCDYGDNGFYIV